jgi:large subunit ribosomal protein L21|uniref:ribosomal protein L21 n=1 Tax=Cryptomonas gyropyrenoidosa TaxID=233257 RepID=UPI00279F3681|nr:ribosomal protein L21 [Cryptomonas gyropyrenoidosa]WFQ82911.1 ribosomal protein L21 [Cryptomonas gyropyrenoidosa]
MISYAIVEASGKQFWIEPGKFYDFNYIDLNPGDKISLLRVLLVNDKGNVIVGKPCLENVSVEATILGHLRDKKIIVYKMRPKKKTRKKQGHRSNLTRVIIDSIRMEGTILI